MRFMLFLFWLLSTSIHAVAGAIEVGVITGEVELTPGAGGDPRPLSTGDRIEEQDRIYTGFDSTAELRFSDGTVVVVRELTDMKVGSFRVGDEAASTRLWLRAGEVDAHVRPLARGQNDFRIQTPTTTCSVRGTNPVVTTALGTTYVSFITGYGEVTDEVTGLSSDTGASQEARNDSEGGLQNNADLEQQSSQGSTGVTGLTAAETSTTASMVPGETVVSRGDVATNTGGAAASSQTFVSDAVAEMAGIGVTVPGPPAPPPPPAFSIAKLNAQATSAGFGFLLRSFDFDATDLAGRQDVVQDVNFSVTFAKGNDVTPPEYHLLQMSLQAPGALATTLIAFNAFQPGTDPFSGTIRFDDQATQGVVVDPTTPVEGTFQPQGSLALFNGRAVTGQWLVVIGNDSTASPVQFESATLEIVPVPAP